MNRFWLVLGSGGVTALAVPRWPAWWSTLTGTADLGTAVAAGGALVGTGLLAWVAAIAVVGSFHAGVARRLGPAWLVAIVLGASVAPATAADHPLSGLPLPTRSSTVPAATHSGPAAPPEAAAPAVHVVVPGDTLWDLAQAQLPASADDLRIAHHVEAWHDQNRDVVGDDPDLLLPGQRLVAPEER